jgi:hypothetical protein
MTRDATVIDIGDMPDLARLARQVASDGRLRVLREDGTDLAVIAPAREPRPTHGRRITAADIKATLATFGAWKDNVDTERLKRDRRELQEPDRPPRRL